VRIRLTSPTTTLTRRQDHFLYALSKDIVAQCADRAVGTIAVGHSKNIRADEDWGRHGNKRLHDWAFETLIQQIEYKAEERGINLKRVDEANLKTSKTCCECGIEADRILLSVDCTSARTASWSPIVT